MTWRPLRALKAVVAGLAVLIGLTAVGASPAYAGLDGPVSPNMDQHCAVETIGSGPLSIAVPVDRITLNLEAVDHDPADAGITATYTVVGTTKTGTTTGEFDAVRSNTTLTFQVSNPPLGAELDVNYQVSWPDGTYYSHTIETWLAPCTLSNTTAFNTSTWLNFLDMTSVSQRCTTIDLGVGGRHAYIRADIVTVNISRGSPYSPEWYAGNSVWADYWIPGTKGYTPGASGIFDANGRATLTFRLLAPPTGAELDVLASGKFDLATVPAHGWVTIAC
ncbi:hypothetical protein [Streptomyces sp. NPDC002671]